MINQITITGSRGFIGTAIRKIIDQPYNEIDHNLGTSHKDLRSQKGTLIHLSASVFEDESYFKPQTYIENNVVDLANILKNNKFSKVIFASSTSVYDKDGNINPKSVYGVTKLAGEQLIKIYCRKYWILRITNPFGPNDKKSVFAKLADCKQNKKTFVIYDNQEARRDFFHVDHVAAIVKDILDEKINPGIYNVGSGKATNVRRLLWDLCKEHNIRFKLAGEPRGMSDGFIPNNDENLLTREKRTISEEWTQYLS